MSTTEHQVAGADVRRRAQRGDGAGVGADGSAGARGSVQPLAAYVPMGVTSSYKPPKAGVDPDTTKTWIKRAYPIVKSHKGHFLRRPHPVLRGPCLQLQIPRVPQRRHRQLARTHTPRFPSISTSTGFWSSA